MMPSWVGTIMVAMMMAGRAFRPRNRSFAKANPAREEKKTTEMVTVVATMAELARPVRKRASGLAKRWVRLWVRLVPGGMVGGRDPRASLVRVAMTNIQ